MKEERKEILAVNRKDAETDANLGNDEVKDKSS
jgi:hypothetical protein